MIKWFKKQDIIVTDFVYAHKKDLATLNNNFKNYNINVNTSSFFQRGEYSNNNIFYPNHYNEDDVNFGDKSYKSQVYNTVKNMYYNDYNNAYNQFGFDTYDKSYATLRLANKFIALNFNVYQLGDGIQPKSVNIKNYSGDIIGTITDDGFNNLYLSGSYFIDKQEYTSSTDNTIQSIGEYGLSNLIDHNTYNHIKYNYKDVPIRIELECVAICEGDNIDLDDLLQSVHLHFLGGLDGDIFEYDNTKSDILEFYDGYNKITGPRSYRKGDIIIVKFTEEFEEDPSSYITVISGDTCTNTYSYTPNDDGGVLPVDECRYVYITPIVDGVRVCDSASGGTEENLKNWIATEMQFNISGLIGDDTGIIIKKDTIQYSDWTDGNTHSPKQIDILPSDPLSQVRFVPSKKNKFNYIPVFNDATLLLTNCDSSIPVTCSIVDFTQTEPCYIIPYRASTTEYSNLIINTVKVNISGLIDGDKGTVEVVSAWQDDLAAGTQIDLICQNFTPDSNNIHTYTPTYINGCLKVGNQEVKNLSIDVDDIEVCQYASQIPIIEQSNFTFTGLIGNDGGTANATILNFNSNLPLGRTFKVIINGFTPSSTNRYKYNLANLGSSTATLIDCGLMPNHVNVIVSVTSSVDTFCPNDEETYPTFINTIIYKDDYNQELSQELQDDIVATEIIPAYIDHSGDYQYDVIYTVIPSTYSFSCKSYDNIQFTVTYINNNIKTNTRTECGIPDQYIITFSANNVSVCADHIVTSEECNYSYSPQLHSELDVIKNVTYSINNITNKITISNAEIEKNGEGLYEYIIRYSDIPGNIIRIPKTRKLVTITPITSIDQGEVICIEDSDTDVINKLTTTYTYSGLESGDTIDPRNISISYDISTDSIITNVEDAVIKMGSEDVCYYYEIDKNNSKGTINIQRQQCTTPQPRVINITFTPDDVTICQGETPNLTYTYNPAPENGDTISNTALEVDGNIIKFINKPVVNSADTTDRVYNVIENTGTLTINLCPDFIIEPQCPDVCIPQNMQDITTSDVENMIAQNINFVPNKLLNINNNINTRDSIKSIKFDINVTEN